MDDSYARLRVSLRREHAAVDPDRKDAVNDASRHRPCAFEKADSHFCMGPRP